MSKVTSIRRDAVVKVPTQNGDKVQIPNNSVGTSELRDLSVTQDKLADSANPFPWIKEGFQSFVDTNYLSPVNGTPTSSQFRTFGIQNRAQIPDLANDLVVSLGMNRMMFHSIHELSNESGPNNERVWATPGDTFNQIRFVGNWSFVRTNEGPHALGVSANDFVEIVFYGTGLNFLGLGTSGRDVRATIDGAAEGVTNLHPNMSSALTSKNWSPNQIYPVTNNLPLGLHSIKLRVQSPNFHLMGIEILNESTTLKVNPGSAYIDGALVSLGNQQSPAYNSGFTNTYGTPGTRGGRVVVYLDSDGVVKKDIQYTETSQGNLASASHANEELIRQFHWREFGVGAAGGFSNIDATGTTDSAFNMDDNLTCLVGDNVFNNTNVANYEGVSLGATGDHLKFTFVGTGCDMLAMVQSGNPDITVNVDGTNVGTLNFASFNSVSGIPTVIKLVSGLPYGTHTVDLTRGAGAASNILVLRYNVYIPKKPTLPAECIEISDYSLVANFSPNVTQGRGYVSTGTIRHSSAREWQASGTWNLGGPSPESVCGFTLSTTTTSDYAEFTFWGDAFDYRFYAPGSASTHTISIDGSTNLSGFTTNAYAPAAVNSWTPATGVLVLNGSSDTGNGLTVSGLSLGKHTFRITKTGGTGAINVEAFDVHMPTHSYREKSVNTIQSNLQIGSCSFADSRKLTPLKGVQVVPANWGIVYPKTSGVTTTSTVTVPFQEMEMIFKATGKPVVLVFDGMFLCSATGQNIDISMFLDGTLLTLRGFTEPVANYRVTIGMQEIVTLTGYHHIKMQWNTSGGTLTAYDLFRSLKVYEIT